MVINGKDRPTVYKDFHEAKERAGIGDKILVAHNGCCEEYTVPDYAKLAELENEIMKLGKFTNARRALILKLHRMMGETLKFEERSKRNG